MFKALLVTASPGVFAPFSSALTSAGFNLARAESGDAALAAVDRVAPDLVIIDDQLRDIPARDLVKRIVQANAFVNTAVVSGMPSDDFHEAFEGLGVLIQLPPRPGLTQAQGLLAALRAVASPAPGKASRPTDETPAT